MSETSAWGAIELADRKPFSPPPFDPSRWVRGGHLQTVFSLRSPKLSEPPTLQHIVRLDDGDAIVLHETPAVDSEAGLADSKPRSLLLIHGLSGCHQSPYMIRMARRFSADGWNVFRADMRGCGAAFGLAAHLNHAGRSDDVGEAIRFVAQRAPAADVSVVGVSLGGNQLLKWAGEAGLAGEAGGSSEASANRTGESTPAWFSQIRKLAAVAPPIDLVRCSKNMQRLARRLYNYYFIRNLFERIPPRVAQRDLFRQISVQRRPKTLYELDDRITAPLSGFASADEYYQRSGASRVTSRNPWPTLVLAAADDPVVPVDCFRRDDWSVQTQVLITKTGGHAGYISRDGDCWMDRCLVAWLSER